MESRDLSNPEDVEELFAIAAAEGCFEPTEDNRLHVYEQAVVDRRAADRPGALFRENVAHARWFGTCGDLDEARRIKCYFDRGIVAPSRDAYEGALVASGDESAEELAAVNDAAAKKREQREGLKALAARLGSAGKPK